MPLVYPVAAVYATAIPTPTPTAHIEMLAEIPPEAPDGIITTFTLDETAVSGTIDVFWDGLLLLDGTDYNLNGAETEYTTVLIPGPGTVIHHTFDWITNVGYSHEIFGETPAPAPDGFSSIFTTANVFNADRLRLGWDGLMMAAPTDYSELAGYQSFQTTAIPSIGTMLRVNYTEAVEATTLPRNTDRQPPETPDGTITTFSTAETYSSGEIQVYYDGLLQTLNIDYKENAGFSSYTFYVPPAPSAIIQHRYRH